MKWTLLLLCAACSPCLAAGTGNFQTVGANIYDPAGNLFVARGINVQGKDCWWPRSILQDANAITVDWKFNIIRVNCELFASIYKDNNDLDAIIQTYTARHCVVMLEAHDRTGSYFQGSDLTALTNWYTGFATRYKDNPYLWFNVQNEPGTGMPDAAKWLNENQTVISAIRDGVGANNMIVCDGTNYGQDTGGDYSAVTLPTANSAILSYGQDCISFNNQTYSNVAFSYHVYDQWNAGGVARMANYVDRVQAAGLPLICGEFGLKNGPFDATNAVHALFDIAPSRNLGWLGWAWYGDGAYDSLVNAASLDPVYHTNGGWMINSPTDPTNLSTMGQMIWDATHVPEPASLALLAAGAALALRRRRSATTAQVVLGDTDLTTASHWHRP